MRTALVPPRAFVLAAGVLLAASALSLSFWVITAHSHREWILPGGSMANSRSHGGSQGSAPANYSAVATNTHACHQCRTVFNRDDGTGYPPVAFRGRMANLVSPSMFRDMADYVISWPWSHFGESVYRLPLRDLNRCLPAVPIVYWKADGSPKHVAAITRRVISFPKPFILITGQSDTPVPSRFPDVLSSPQLLRWFGQNNDMLPLHPKFTPIPIGLNCWEHCTAMERYLTARKPGVDATPKKTFLVNFSPNTDAKRGKIRALLCNSELSTNTTCVNWVRTCCELSLWYEPLEVHIMRTHAGRRADSIRSIGGACVTKLRGYLAAYVRHISCIVFASYVDCYHTMLLTASVR